MLPRTLEKCPIVDSVVEIRFNSKIFPQAVFGVIYEQLKHKFQQVEQLPILQLPQVIIDSDAGLKNQAHFRLKGDFYFVQTGPRVLSICSGMPYIGWEKSFFPTIVETLELVFKIGVIESVTRLGIRYTNFLRDQDVFQKVNLKIQLNNEAIPFKKTLLRTELESSGFNNTLQISNDAFRQEQGTLNRLKPLVAYGSIIDIDTFKDYNPPKTNLAELLKDIDLGHHVEKDIFWGLLTDELRKDLKPVY